MKKSFLAFCLGLLVSAAGVSGTSFASQAAEIQAEVMEVSVEDATQVDESELQIKKLQASPIQEGNLHNAKILTEGEVPVLQAGEYWASSLSQRITEGLANYQTYVDVADLGIYETAANIQGVIEVYQAVLDGNPGFFYATGGFGYMYYPTTGQITDIILYYDDYTYYTDENGVQYIDMNKINAYNVAKSRAMSVVKDGMTDVEKLLALHDYLALNCTYDYVNYLNNTLPSQSYSSYGALVAKQAVCSGYAMAYAELVRTAGIPCYIVASDEMDHAWNLVYVDGAWYHIDVTWDDPVSDYTADYDTMGWLEHSSFLRSDAEMQNLGYHDWFHEFTENALPAATQSGSYANTIFRATEGGVTLAVKPLPFASFTYHDGFWYYLSLVEGADYYTNYGFGVITRSRLDGSEASFWTDEGNFMSLQMIDGRMFYSDAVGMYTATLNSDLQPERIMTPLGSKSLVNCLVMEFVVYGDGTIGAEFVDIYGGTCFTRTYDVNTRETVPMPVLTITKAPTINYTSDPGEAYVNGEYAVNFSDGTAFAVASDELYVYHDAMTQEGVYDVILEWRGIMTSYQVSLKTDFPVTDVLASDTNWKYNGIKYVLDNGYMSGINESQFAPDNMLSRSMLVQILYAMENKPTVTYSDRFTDVTADAWYANAVIWAAENGITSGYEDGRFGVNDNITREQTAVMLMKYAELKGYDVTGRADLASFIDASSVNTWATNAMSWANYNGVISGKLDAAGTKLDPTGYASRAEMAAMITKFCKNWVE